MIISNYYQLVIMYIVLQDTLQMPRTKTVFNEVDTCECGRPSHGIAPRIVGGQVAESDSYPWMVAIFSNNRMHCGGSIINDRYILTAGHCLNSLKKEDLKVVLGVTDLRKLPPTQGGRSGTPDNEIESTLIHEDFASDYLHDTEDIGLIKLKKPIRFNSNVNPICMPLRDSNFENRTVMVTGWGKTNENGTPSRSLRKASLRVMRHEDCKNVETVGEHLTDSMLCAYEQETDACQGDSGGPLIIENQGKVEQIGIVSWGIGCATPGFPGVYSRMTSYLDWLSRHTQDAVYCKYK